MKKRIFILVMLAAMVITACSNGSQSSGGSQPSGNQPAASSSSSSQKKYDQGVTDTEIKIGNWTPRSGPVGQYKAAADGAEAYFNKINAEGGINGRKIKFISLDDQYEPSRTVAAAKRLVEQEKVFAIVSALGTGTNQAAKPYIEEVGIPIMVYTGSSVFTNPPIKNYFGFLTNYEVEAQTFVKYAHETLGAKRFGILYQTDDLGKSSLAVVQDYVSKNPGLEIVAEVSNSSSDVDFSAAAIKLKEADPDVIFGFTNQTALATFWKEYTKLGGDAQFMVNSTTGFDNKLFELVGPSWNGVISTTSSYSLDDVENPMVKEFLDHYTKDFPNSNLDIGKNSWISAQIMVEALRRCGDELTWENFIKQMESLKDWKGSLLFNVTYSPSSRYGSTGFYMMQAENGTYKPISDLITIDVE